MGAIRIRAGRHRLALAASLAALAVPVSIFAVPTAAGAAAAFGAGHGRLTPGNLLVTTSAWTANANITAGTTQLPPNCATANPAFVTCGTAVAPGTYPIVFNNDAPDGSFGVTAEGTLATLNDIRPALAHNRYSQVQAVIPAEIGDITRFKNAAQLCSWAGLTPRHRESGTKVARGHVTKQGSRLLRWALIEAIQRVPRDSVIGGVKDAIITRRGKEARNIAKAAAARRLLTLVFYGLRDGQIRCLARPATPPAAAGAA